MLLLQNCEAVVLSPHRGESFAADGKRQFSHGAALMQLAGINETFSFNRVGIARAF